MTVRTFGSLVLRSASLIAALDVQHAAAASQRDYICPRRVAICTVQGNIINLP